MKGIIFFLVMLPCILSAQTVVRWHTSMGNYTAELREDLVPVTAYNFIGLTNDNFYDGLIFHRVIDGFVIQDGDPTGTGYGGSGTTIPLEIHPDLIHNTQGTIGMARSQDPNSASSQYYITLEPTPWLDGDYAVFGYVFEGMDVVQAIGDVETDENDRPIIPVYIDSIRVLTPNVSGFEPQQRDLEVNLGETEYFLMICMDFPVDYYWFYDDEPVGNNEFLLGHTFSDPGLHQITAVVSTGTEYDYLKNWNIQVIGSSAEAEIINSPEISLACYPNPFNLSGGGRSPGTTITFELKKAAEVELSVYNIKGQKIKTFNNNPCHIGQNTVAWNGDDDNGKPVGSGVYFFSITNGNQKVTKKMMLIK